jgi:molybdopterin converting factor small subunit
VTITVRYLAQMKQAAGTAVEQVQATAGCSARTLMERLGRERGGTLERALLTTEGKLRPSVMLFIGDRQVVAGDDGALSDGDELLVMSPIAGG